jgi:2-octaprenyl-6-methoxyphenol hydroxylase
MLDCDWSSDVCSSDLCVLEARAGNTASQDARALALSYGSRLLLQRLGVWHELPDVTQIQTIHVSQQKSFGRTVLNAAEMNVPELGYVLPYAALQAVLDKALQRAVSFPSPAGGITSDLAGVRQPSRMASSPIRGAGGEGEEANVIFGAQVTELHSEADYATISYQQNGVEQTLTARLTVVADGGKLLAQRHPPEVRDYGQSALITHITCSTPRANTAFERFTPHGPIALLPFNPTLSPPHLRGKAREGVETLQVHNATPTLLLQEGGNVVANAGYELVWTASHVRAQEMLSWDDETFLCELQQQFGDRVGEFLTVGKRTCFALGLKRAPDTTLPHTVLLGNAAQTLHPVAGQGFNMGLRDAWELAQEILRAQPEELGSQAMLARYRASRQLDRNAGIRFTDGLVRLFSNDLPLIRPVRAAADRKSVV